MTRLPYPSNQDATAARPRRKERGVVLILVLILLVALTFGATAFLSIVVAEREVTVIYRMQSLCDNAIESGKNHVIATIENAYVNDVTTDLNGAYRNEFIGLATEEAGGAEGMYLWDVQRHNSTWGNLERLPAYTPHHSWFDENDPAYDADLSGLTGDARETKIKELDLAAALEYQDYHVYDPDPESAVIDKLWPRWIYIGYFDVNWDPTEEENDARYVIRYSASVIDLSGLLQINRTVAWDAGLQRYAYTEYGGDDANLGDYGLTAKYLMWKGMSITGSDGNTYPAEADVTSMLLSNERSMADEFNWRTDYISYYNWSGMAETWLISLYKAEPSWSTWGSDAEKQTMLWTPFGNSDMIVVYDTDGDPLTTEDLATTSDDPNTVKWQVNINTAPRRVIEAMVIAMDERLKDECQSNNGKPTRHVPLARDGSTDPYSANEIDRASANPIWEASAAGQQENSEGAGLDTIVDLIMDNRPFNSTAEVMALFKITDYEDWEWDSGNPATRSTIVAFLPWPSHPGGTFLAGRSRFSNSIRGLMPAKTRHDALAFLHGKKGLYPNAILCGGQGGGQGNKWNDPDEVPEEPDQPPEEVPPAEEPVPAGDTDQADWRMAALLGFARDGGAGTAGSFTTVNNAGNDVTILHGMHLTVGRSRFYRAIVKAQVYDLTLDTALLERDYEFVYQVDPDESAMGVGTNHLFDSNVLYQHRHEGQ